MFYNVEQLPNRNHITGYGAGEIFHINKEGDRYVARSVHSDKRVVTRTLKAMSEKLEAMTYYG